MDVREHIKHHLDYKQMMQIATAAGEQPWICTVFFVADEAQNIYWLSTPERRHSKEIAANPNVAIAVPVKSDWPVIGIQAEGTAAPVADADEVKRVMESYSAKYGKGQDFYDNFVKGTNEHNLYKFSAKTFVLFDEVNYAGDPRQVWERE